MHYLSEEHILIFLTQLFILLSLSKLIGNIVQKYGVPALAGEIMTGILLGPTVFGRFGPGLYSKIFPSDLIQQNMLETITWVGLLYLLLSTGFEVNLSSALKQGKAAFSIGIIGVVIPFILAFSVFYMLPDTLIYRGALADHLSFSLFISIAASISALAVIARVLHDLRIIKSDLGLLTLSGFVVNDLFGWLLFAIVIGFVSNGSSMDIAGAFKTFSAAALFGLFTLTLGSRIFGYSIRKLKQLDLPQPASTLTFISVLAILCGAVTQWIGVHAIIGFFLAGIMAGNTNEVSERSRETISQMVHSVFVPVFFAAIGLKVDFLKNTDIFMVIVFTSVAVGGKFIGAWAGAKTAGLSKEDSFSMGIAFIPGGAMEIVLGLLALELSIISEITFVAVVFAALFSSVLVGPLLSWTIRKRSGFDAGDFLSHKGIIPELKGSTKWEVIAELCGKISPDLKNISCKDIRTAVREREEIMGTGMTKGLAVPHGRLDGLEKPVIAFGRSSSGIDWDSSDGSPAKFIFLILTPLNDQSKQVQILAGIAKTISSEEYRNSLFDLNDEKRIFSSLRNRLRENSVS